MLLLSGIFVACDSGTDDGDDDPVIETSLELIEHTDTLTISLFGENNIEAEFKNTTTDIINIKAKIEFLETTTGHSVSICWGSDGTCYPPQSSDWETPSFEPLASDETAGFSFFHGVFNAGDPVISGTTIVKFTIWVEGAPDDKIDFETVVIAGE